MKVYDCYFDASYKSKVARCAYYIKREGRLAYHKAYNINVSTSAKAEAASLHGLLIYLSTHVEDGSIINIYGDALFLFENIASRRNKNYEKIKLLIKQMKNRFELTIKYIPRSENSVAHRLTKGKPMVLDNKTISNKVLVERRIVQLDRICIPSSMKNNPPAQSKLKTKQDYFIKHGCLKKNIKVNNVCMLVDGYASYLILREHNVQECVVDVIEKRKINPPNEYGKAENIMVKVTGEYNTALCYTNELEPASLEQVRTLCNRQEFANSKIRIMPDVHAGKGCTIGTTMTISDKIVPGMVGVDIGCGMETVRIAEKEIDYAVLDELIRNEIPSSFEIRPTNHSLNAEIDLTALRIADNVNIERAKRSIGTLGGGNHFIEVARSSTGDLYIIVHSGSRHLGTEVANYYQDEAYKTLCGNSKTQIEEAISVLKKEDRQKEIAGIIKEMKNKKSLIYTKDLSYVSDKLFDNYIHDMKLMQHFAMLNRKAMIEVILRGMGLTETDRFTTIHNYIDTDAMILRKGAVSAKNGELLLIPINMRDGSLICIGKGNDDWNQSAPHGAGRLMSRTAAFKALSMNDYESEMKGIFTTSVNRKTLDEAPMAYKSIDEIIKHITPTAEIIERLRPTYNFKASE